MFFKKKAPADQIPASTVVALAIAVVALVTAVGTAKWTLFIVDDLVSLRQDFAALRNEQDQLKIQFDYWDQKVSEERMMIRKLKNDMMQPNGATTPQ